MGGTGQLGFLAKSENGDWRFTSLQAQARAAGASAVEEIWDVARTESGPVFVAAQQGWPGTASSRSGLFDAAADRGKAK